MKLILENWQKFVNEEIIEEAPKDSVRRWFGTSLGKIKDPAEKLQKAEELLTIAQDAVKTKDITKIAPQVAKSGKQDIINQYLEGINQLLKSQAPDGNPRSLANKLRAAVAATENPKEKAAVLGTGAKEVAKKENIPPKEAAEKTIAAVSTDAAKNPKTVSTVVAAMGETEGSTASPEQLKTAVDKAAENAKKSQNPDQQIKKDSETIAKNMGQPEKAEEIGKAIEDKVEDEPAQGEQANDPEIVDPSDENLQAIRTSFAEFKNDFYDKTKIRGLKDQAGVVNKLLKALRNFATAEQKAAALGRASGMKKGEITEVEVAPKNIGILKTRIRNFQRALKASEQYIVTYQRKLDRNLKMVKGDRDKLVKIAEKTQETIFGLNKAINGILGIAKKEQEQEQLTEATAGEKYFAMLEEIEAVYDELTTGKMLQIMNNLDPEKPTQMVWAEIRPIIKNALEQLNKIKKYFPQIVPFEGSEVESTELLKKYKEAIEKIDLDASDIQTLPDEITDDDGGIILTNFQSKLIDLSKDIQKIFGVAGLSPEKDSAKAKNIEPEPGPEGTEPGEEQTTDEKIEAVGDELEPEATEAIEKAQEQLGPNADANQIATQAQAILSQTDAAEKAQERARVELEAAELEQAEKLALQKAQANIQKAEERFKNELDNLGVTEPAERAAVTKFLGLLFGEGVLSEDFEALTDATTGVIKQNTLKRILGQLSAEEKDLVKKVLDRSPEKFVEMIRSAKKGVKDPEKRLEIPFKSKAEITKFFDFKMFKDKTLLRRLQNVGIDTKNLVSPDFINLKKFLAYFLANKTVVPVQEAETNPDPTGELAAEDEPTQEQNPITVVVKLGTILSADKSQDIIAIMRQKDKELVEWARGFFKINTNFKKMFESIKEYLKEKAFKFDTKGLTASKLAGFNFASSEPEEEAEEEKPEEEPPPTTDLEGMGFKNATPADKALLNQHLKAEIIDAIRSEMDAIPVKEDKMARNLDDDYAKEVGTKNIGKMVEIVREKYKNLWTALSALYQNPATDDHKAVIVYLKTMSDLVAKSTGRNVPNWVTPKMEKYLNTARKEIKRNNLHFEIPEKAANEYYKSERVWKIVDVGLNINPETGEPKEKQFPFIIKFIVKGKDGSEDREEMESGMSDLAELFLGGVITNEFNNGRKEKWKVINPEKKEPEADLTKTQAEVIAAKAKEAVEATKEEKPDATDEEVIDKATEEAVQDIKQEKEDLFGNIFDDPGGEIEMEDEVEKLVRQFTFDEEPEEEKPEEEPAQEKKSAESIIKDLRKIKSSLDINQEKAEEIDKQIKSVPEGSFIWQGQMAAGSPVVGVDWKNDKPYIVVKQSGKVMPGSETEKRKIKENKSDRLMSYLLPDKKPFKSLKFVEKPKSKEESSADQAAADAQAAKEAAEKAREAAKKEADRKAKEEKLKAAKEAERKAQEAAKAKKAAEAAEKKKQEEEAKKQAELAAKAKKEAEEAAEKAGAKPEESDPDSSEDQKVKELKDKFRKTVKSSKPFVIEVENRIDSKLEKSYYYRIADIDTYTIPDKEDVPEEFRGRKTAALKVIGPFDKEKYLNLLALDGSPKVADKKIAFNISHKPFDEFLKLTNEAIENKVITQPESTTEGPGLQLYYYERARDEKKDLENSKKYAFKLVAEYGEDYGRDKPFLQAQLNFRGSATRSSTARNIKSQMFLTGRRQKDNYEARIDKKTKRSITRAYPAKFRWYFKTGDDWEAIKEFEEVVNVKGKKGEDNRPLYGYFLVNGKHKVETPKDFEDKIKHKYEDEVNKVFIDKAKETVFENLVRALKPLIEKNLRGK